MACRQTLLLISRVVFSFSNYTSCRVQGYQKFQHQELSYSSLNADGDVELFPDVTLCNQLMVSRSHTDKMFDIIWKYFESPFYTNPTCQQTYIRVDYPMEFGDPEVITRMMSGNCVTNYLVRSAIGKCRSVIVPAYTPVLFSIMRVKLVSHF